MKDLASTLSGAVMPGDEASAFVRSQLNSGEPQLPQSDPRGGWNTAKGFGQFAAGFAPGGGIADAAGQLGGPSIKENWKQGNYGTAALQGLGVAGDALQAVPGLGTIMGAAVKAPAAAKMGMFLGAGAKIADKVKLAKAQQMFDSGATRDAIREATDWFRGPDGKWKFEISDHAATIDPKAAAAFNDMHPSSDMAFMHNSDRVLNHPELHEAYPDMWATNIQLSKSDAPAGQFMLLNDGRQLINVESPNLPDARSAMLHELQHSIQMKEGFATGGGPSEFGQQKQAQLARDAMTFRDELDAARAATPSITPEAATQQVVDSYKGMGAEDWLPSQAARDVALDFETNPDQQLQELVKYYGLDRRTSPYSDMEMYKRLAGEVEARTVEARRNMLPAERAATPPWQTWEKLGYPAEDQLVKFHQPSVVSGD